MYSTLFFNKTNTTMKRHQTFGQRTCMQTNISICQSYSQQCTLVTRTSMHALYTQGYLPLQTCTSARFFRACNRTADAYCMRIAVITWQTNVCQCTEIFTSHLHNHACTLYLSVLTAADTHISADRRRPPGPAAVLPTHSACKKCQYKSSTHTAMQRYYF
jgi:hypothetical protein